jgi:hypothetical protein
MLLINVYHGGQILNTSTGVGYDIRAACTFSTDETMNIHDLKRQIYIGLKLLSSHFNISISAQINTVPPGLGNFFIVHLGLFLKKIWGMVKTTVPYQIPGYKTLELVVESELIFNSDHYDPISIPESSNPILAEERIPSSRE